MKFNEKLKEYRKIFGLSQEKLAEKLNVSRQVITKWENDIGLPEISNLKCVAKLFGVSVDYLLDEERNIEYPILREEIILDKNNYSNRYDYVVSYLKKEYADQGSIYALTELEKENSKLTEITNFLTFGISNLSYITEWISSPAIWFVVEMEKQNLIVKATKNLIEIRELSSVVDTNKFTFDKTKLLKLKNKI
ncbi:MAG: helix-turn-helix transcriptional regulator [Clostridia bacterium]|nr:helix-turn-helix transcriptional regulator [Clostridia bacterium]